jgi:hypothetical protein
VDEPTPTSVYALRRHTDSAEVAKAPLPLLQTEPEPEVAAADPAQEVGAGAAAAVAVSATRAITPPRRTASFRNAGRLVAQSATAVRSPRRVTSKDVLRQSELRAEEQILSSMLFRAAKSGSESAVASLLRNKAPVDCAGMLDGISGTPLHFAARFGHLNVVLLLLQSGADPSIINSDGATALSCAAMEGHIDVAAHLLRAGEERGLETFSDHSTTGPLQRHRVSRITGQIVALPRGSLAPEASWESGTCQVVLVESEGNGSPRSEGVHVSRSSSLSDVQTPRETHAGAACVELRWRSAEDAATISWTSVEVVLAVRPCKGAGAGTQFEAECSQHTFVFAAEHHLQRDAWVRTATMILARHLNQQLAKQLDMQPAPLPAQEPPATHVRTRSRRGLSCCSGRVDEGVRAKAKGDAVNARVRPSERVTLELDAAENGANPQARGWANQLPVVIVPGFCSSGLLVKQSRLMPSWTNERVWFSLQKLGIKHMHGEGDGEGPRDCLTVHVHNAKGLSPQLLKDNPALLARITVYDRRGRELAMRETKATLPNASRQMDWSEELELSWEAGKVPAKMKIEVVDDDEWKPPKIGDTTIKLGDVERDVPNLFNLDSGVGVLTLSTGTVEHKGVRETDNAFVRAAQRTAHAAAHAVSEELHKAERAVVKGLHRDGGSPPKRSQSKSDLSPKPKAKQDVAKAFNFSNSGNDDQDSDDDANNDDDGSDLGQRSMWIQHMMLDPDGHSDPQSGVQVRAVPGVGGVNYLQPGIMASQTWVFGKVTDRLASVGYGRHNLRAVPYDWRLPPKFLQDRDQYFTGVITLIEKTYERNGGRPVVLLGHSMGCKMVHYMLWWIVNEGPSHVTLPSGDPFDGVAWLAKHVFSFFAVGGPFLGSRSSLRAMLSGDDMGINSGGIRFITKADIINLSRSMGSGMWLWPEGILRTANPFALAYRRDESVLRVEVISASFKRDAFPDGTELYVEVSHSKTRQRKRKTVTVKTLDAVGGSDSSDDETSAGRWWSDTAWASKGSRVKYTWGTEPAKGQKFQFVSGKWRLGDQIFEQVDVKVKFDQDGDAEVAKDAKSTVAAGTTLGSVHTTVNELFNARRGGDDESDPATLSSTTYVIPPGMLSQIAHAFTAADLDTRTRTKRMRAYEYCWVAGEAIEWLRCCLSSLNCDSSAATAQKIFWLLHKSGMFEILDDPAVNMEESLMADAYILCRTLSGGGASLLNGSIQGSLNHFQFDECTALVQFIPPELCDKSVLKSLLESAFGRVVQVTLRIRPDSDKSWAIATFINAAILKVALAQGKLTTSSAAGVILAPVSLGTALTSTGQFKAKWEQAQKCANENVSKLLRSTNSASDAQNSQLYGDPAYAAAATKIQAEVRGWFARKSKSDGERFTHMSKRYLRVERVSKGGLELVGELLVKVTWLQTENQDRHYLDADTQVEALPDGHRLLEAHGASENVKWWHKYYKTDPNYLRGGAVFKPPPIKRMFHCYGTGIDTVWSFVYKSKDGMELKSRGLNSLGLEFDTDATLGDQNYKLKGGCIFETENTLQHLPDNLDTSVRTSGDGTVPYQSLRFPQTWNSPTFLSQTVEMPKGNDFEHRQILANSKFHDCLVEYLTETVVVYVLEAKDICPMDGSGETASSDPYCRVWMEGK